MEGSYNVVNKKERDRIITRITVGGKEKSEILKQCHKTVSGWDLELPGVNPSVLHFGLNRFGEIGEIEFDIINDAENCYCGKFIFMFGGQKCPKHYHRFKKETFFVVKGKVHMNIDNIKSILDRGSTATVERGQKHEFIALEDSLILESSNPDLLFDSIFSDSKINSAIFSFFEENQTGLDEKRINKEIARTGFGSSIVDLSRLLYNNHKSSGGE